MKVSELKTALSSMESVCITGIDGQPIPAHFHLTEIGSVSKNFIDCGGKLRMEKSASLQLWYANDLEHRLTPEKFIKIIKLAEETLGLGDVDVEVEYQTDTVGKYALGLSGNYFVLLPKFTACLASDSCGVDEAKPKLQLSELKSEASCCAPGGNCC